MHTLRLTFVSILFMGAAFGAQASEPDWSSYISTGHAADGQIPAASNEDAVPSEPTWNAFIGTGHVSDTWHGP
jgi:hypothetical protein